MKKLLFILCSILSIHALAQNKIVKPRGSIDQKKMSLSPFHTLEIDLNADFEITMGAMPMIEIEAASNVLDKINFQNKGGTLSISTKKGFWLEGARPKITIRTTVLKELTTLGSQTNVGTVLVRNIDVPEFRLNQLRGDVTLLGSCGIFILNSSNRSYYRHSGTLNAEDFMATQVKGYIHGSNSAVVFAQKEIKCELKYDAELTVLGSPNKVNIIGKGSASKGNFFTVRDIQEEKRIEEPILEKVPYVSLTIKNNTMSRRQFVIAGPNNRGGRFSYGFPMNPYAIREERVPVGTKFYLGNSKLGKVLLTVSEENEGKTIDLF